MMALKCREGDLALMMDTVPGDGNKSGRLVLVKHRGIDDPYWGPTWVVTSIIEDDGEDYPSSVTEITIHPAEVYAHPDALLVPFGEPGSSEWAAEQAIGALDEHLRVRRLFRELSLDAARLSDFPLKIVVEDSVRQTTVH